MECFVFNAVIETTQVAVRDPGFGTPIELGEIATIRGLLSADEAELRLGELFTRFMEEVRDENARGELKEAHQWVLQGSTQLHNNLALSLRIFREFLPQAFLLTLLGPNDPSEAPRYRLNSLDELRGLNGTLVFSSTAQVCEPKAKTLEL